MTDGRQWGPVEQRCGTCRHYQPTRNPDTWRVLPSKAGKCGYEVEWPDLPICYWSTTYSRLVSWPEKFPVWPGTDAKDCLFWTEARRKPKQEELPL